MAKQATSTSTTYRNRPLHDLTARELALLLSALTAFCLPPGLALAVVVLIGLIHLLTNESTSSHLKRLMRGHYQDPNPQTRERITAYERALVAQQAGDLSEQDTLAFYQLVGSLTKSSPKPVLSLHKWRFDLACLGLVLLYQLQTLYVMFPAVMDTLFFKR